MVIYQIYGRNPPTRVTLFSWGHLQSLLHEPLFSAVLLVHLLLFLSNLRECATQLVGVDLCRVLHDRPLSRKITVGCWGMAFGRSSAHMPIIGLASPSYGIGTDSHLYSMTLTHGCSKTPSRTF